MTSKMLKRTLALSISTALLAGSIRANDHNSKSSSSTTFDQNGTVNVSQLIHSRVVDQSGQKIGDLEDIIVDQTSGRAQFGVIKLTGDLADHGKYTPVPFTLLKFNDADRKDSFGHRDLTLQVDRNKLLSASRFSTSTWPDRDHVAWGPEVYTYYGVNSDTATVASTSSSSSWAPSSGSTYSATTTPGRDVVVQNNYATPARTTTYDYRRSTTYSDKPIDNGTGPDGRDTFHFTPRPWPYSEIEAGATGPAFSTTVGTSDSSRVIVQPDTRPADRSVVVQNYNTQPTDRSVVVQNYDSRPDNSQVVIERHPSRTTRVYQYNSYSTVDDKPIDNGTGPDGRDTFHFTPRPWPYQDAADAH